MRVDILRWEITEAYDRYLMGNSSSLFSYSSKYKNFLKDLLTCQEEYLVATGEADILGVLPLMYTEGEKGRVYNSLPYYGSNGGVIADNADAYQALVNSYNEIARSKTTISSTIVSNPFAQQDASHIWHNHTDYRIGQFTNISFRSNHWDEIISRIDPSARRNVSKAIREGVTVEIDSTQMEWLGKTHQDNISAIGGLPKSDRFFELAPRHFSPAQDFDLYVAKKDGVVVAGLLIFYFNQTVEYFTPAIEEQYRSVQPLALILVTAMSDASRRGFKRWNWQGTWATQTGVYRFKKKFAALERKYHYYTQLNESSMLNWPQADIISAFPNFFVVPFSALKVGKEEHGR